MNLRPLLGVLLVLARATPALAGPPAREERGTLLPDMVVRFQQGKAILDAESEEALDRMAQQLKAKKELDWVLIVGHTDDRGSVAANRALSVRRAMTVRTELIQRGIAGSRLSVMGAGAAEPLSNEDTPEALALNRRVELWVAPQVPVAFVTWIHKSVEAKAPIAEDWSPAELRMPLRRLFQVRTLAESASEITFDADSKLAIGADALVVIYDNPTKRKRAAPERKRVADVEVFEGDVFARLARLEATPVKVKTEAAEIELTSKSAKVSHRKDRNASTVSVYEGRAQVASEGKRVAVDKGEGTRIKVGAPPEPPRPLIAAPKWTTKDPLVVVGTSSTSLEWIAAAGTSTVQLTIARPDDAAFERPIKEWRVRGKSASFAKPPEGVYRVRLTAEDDRGVAGVPGAPLRMVVMSAPLDGAGRMLGVARGRVRLPGPGLLVPPSARGGKVVFEGAQESLRLVAPGEHRVRYTIQVADGTVFSEGELTVTVDTPSVVMEPPAPAVEGTVSRTDVRFRVEGTDGSPITGMKLAAFRVGRPDPRLRPRMMTPCACSAPERAVPAVEEAPGTYHFTYEVAARNGFSNDLVKVVDAEAGLAQELEVPVGVLAPFVPPPRDTSGFAVAVRVGPQVSSSGGAFWIGAEGGLRLHVASWLSTDLGVEAAWVRSALGPAGDSPGVIDAFPLRARASLIGHFGNFGVYAGGAGGVDLVASSLKPGRETTTSVRAAQPGWRAFGGVAYTLGAGELILEPGYGAVPIAGTGVEGTLGGFTLLAGYRLMPWWTAPVTAAPASDALTVPELDPFDQ